MMGSAILKILLRRGFFPADGGPTTMCLNVVRIGDFSAQEVDLPDCMRYVVVFDNCLRQGSSIWCIIAFSLRVHKFTGAVFLDKLAAPELDHDDAVICHALSDLLGIHTEVLIGGSQH
jgi:hypothetical protein